jgi:hypothetical protein
MFVSLKRMFCVVLGVVLLLTDDSKAARACFNCLSLSPCSSLLGFSVILLDFRFLVRLVAGAICAVARKLWSQSWKRGEDEGVTEKEEGGQERVRS